MTCRRASGRSPRRSTAWPPERIRFALGFGAITSSRTAPTRSAPLLAVRVQTSEVLGEICLIGLSETDESWFTRKQIIWRDSLLLPLNMESLNKRDELITKSRLISMKWLQLRKTIPRPGSG
jgi:hypothetical protein